ncbi:hypothetical protein [Mycoplana dimorpha]|uniref:Uncharacterized protein n=1 Tax=Mycoplana dimorpha TaxID=28320 RepID=A0A2T5ATX4_MYCDI|nr:hypothetical protein [Mycoplana dimorpha]PTM90178.1 hypothetical protein C7449_11061 [Mycoplana dimorpha]
MLDERTKIEQNKNITGKEPTMTEFMRDLAAFASITMFVASLSVLALGM